jgi:competence protein ComGF
MDHNQSNSDHSNDQVFNGESFVEDLRNELQEIDAMEVGDHAQRFEALHQKLNQALSSIDGM